MTASEVLVALRAGGHEPTLVNGRLRVRRASALPQALRNGIDVCAREIIDLLAPPDGPIEPSTAEWLSSLSEESRRTWWRAVARHRCEGSTWLEAEKRARAEWCPPDSNR